MITDDNYKLEIRTLSVDSDSALGLVSGTYKWAIQTDGYFYDCAEDVLEDVGITSPTRTIDTRTGGGNSQQLNIPIKISLSKYEAIKEKAPILGLRCQLVRAYTYTSSIHLEREIYTGAVDSVDIMGATAVLNVSVESKGREVELPRNSSIFGEAVVDGSETGEDGYIQVNGYKAVLRCSSVTKGQTYLNITFGGATPANESSIDAISNEMQSRISNGENVYYEGATGLYKLIGLVASGSGEKTYRTTAPNSYNVAQDETASEAVGNIYWSTKVYNDGIIGEVVVDVEGEEIVIDDVNGNVASYKDGYAVDAGDGYAWRKLELTRDYSFEADTYGANVGLSTFTNYSGVYVSGDSLDPSDVVVSGVDNLPDWDESTTASATFTNTEPRGAYIGTAFNMSGYKFVADKILAVVDYTIDGLHSALSSVPKYVDVFVTSYQDGTVDGEAPVGPEVADGVFRFAISTSTDIPRTYRNMPKEYYNSPDTQGQFDFYNPTTEEQDTAGTVVIDLTDFMADVGDSKYYDGYRFFIAIGGQCQDVLGTTLEITARQINLVEGYELGVDGLKQNKIQVDNSATNGTIPLAYAYILKRQNLQGISSTPPADGWGTEQVQYDGFGAPLDGNYIMSSIPAGELNGIASDADTTTCKKEIARSVPAVSGFDRYGKETLFPIGAFDVEETELLLYSDLVKKDSVNIKAYDMRNITPSMQFVFSGKRVQVNNVEADSYSSAYVLDEVGLSASQKEDMWDAGHALYVLHGTTTKATESTYNLVNDADGVYRIAMALYANMGYVDGRALLRYTITAETKKNYFYDNGQTLKIDMPMFDGFGVISSAKYGVYEGTNVYAIDAVRSAEAPVIDGDILQHGDDADDILETGSQADDILQTGSN